MRPPWRKMPMAMGRMRRVGATVGMRVISVIVLPEHTLVNQKAGIPSVHYTEQACYCASGWFTTKARRTRRSLGFGFTAKRRSERRFDPRRNAKEREGF